MGRSPAAFRLVSSRMTSRLRTLALWGFCSTGRSDYPNQINNVLVFSGVFRGALDARASDINDAMKIAAAHAIAGLISDEELNADYIIPDATDPRVKDAVASAVCKAAHDSGVARI